MAETTFSMKCFIGKLSFWGVMWSNNEIKVFTVISHTSFFHHEFYIVCMRSQQRIFHSCSCLPGIFCSICLISQHGKGICLQKLCEAQEHGDVLQLCEAQEHMLGEIMYFWTTWQCHMRAGWIMLAALQFTAPSVLKKMQF